MDEQYFNPSPQSAHDARVFEHTWAGRALRFETDAGVFSKRKLDSGTLLLLASLPKAFAGRALDLGCGWGAMGICMLAMWPGANVCMTDINARAVALARANLRANGLDAEVWQGDGLSQATGCFDLIATNPPIRAGKAVVYRLFEESLARLAPGGALYAVMRRQQGADSAARWLGERCGRVEIAGRGGGYRVFRARG